MWTANGCDFSSEFQSRGKAAEAGVPEEVPEVYEGVGRRGGDPPFSGVDWRQVSDGRETDHHSSLSGWLARFVK